MNVDSATPKLIKNSALIMPISRIIELIKVKTGVIIPLITVLVLVIILLITGITEHNHHLAQVKNLQCKIG